MKLLYLLRKDAAKGYDTYPIILRVTTNKRSIYTTEFAIKEEDWSQKGQIAVGRGFSDLNRKLIMLKQKAQDIYDDQIRKKGFCDAKKVTELLGNKKVGIKVSDVIEKYRQFFIATGGRAPATIQKYKWIRSLVLSHDCIVEATDRSYSNNLWFYLKSDCKLSIRTANKYYEQIIAAVRFAEEKGWIKKHGMVPVREKHKSKEIIFLNKEELLKIESKKFGERLSEIRDVFLFQCYTGMEYSRVKNLTMSNFQVGIDGRMWTFTKRQKTDTQGNLPLHPKAKELIDKYADHDCRLKGRVFPVKSNVKSNEYLKEIMAICHIDKHMTTHKSRHTFATTVCLFEGISYEATANMMGVSIQTLIKNYGKIVNARVSRETQIWESKEESQVHHTNKENSASGLGI